MHTCKKIHTKCFVSEDRMCSTGRSVGGLELGIKGAETGLPALTLCDRTLCCLFGVKPKPLETITIASAGSSSNTQPATWSLLTHSKRYFMRQNHKKKTNIKTTKRRLENRNQTNSLANLLNYANSEQTKR